MGVEPTSQAWEDLRRNLYKPLKIEQLDFFDETFDETFLLFIFTKSFMFFLC